MKRKKGVNSLPGGVVVVGARWWSVFERLTVVKGRKKESLVVGDGSSEVLKAREPVCGAVSLAPRARGRGRGFGR